MIIGSMIPIDDSLWDCYLNLLNILDICTARVVSDDLPDYLDSLVMNHHLSFKRCYPGASLTPKMHYMVHFPTQIRK